MGTHKERKADSKGHRCPQVTFEPLLETPYEFTKKNGYVKPLLDGTADLTGVIGEWGAAGRMGTYHSLYIGACIPTRCLDLGSQLCIYCAFKILLVHS